MNHLFAGNVIAMNSGPWKIRNCWVYFLLLWRRAPEVRHGSEICKLAFPSVLSRYVGSVQGGSVHVTIMPHHAVHHRPHVGIFLSMLLRSTRICDIFGVGTRKVADFSGQYMEKIYPKIHTSRSFTRACKSFAASLLLSLAPAAALMASAMHASCAFCHTSCMHARPLSATYAESAMSTTAALFFSLSLRSRAFCT